MNLRRISFPGQKENEEVLFMLQKNWVTDFLAIIRFFIVGVLPTGIVISLSYFLSKGVTDITWFFLLFLLVFMLQYSFVVWRNDELDLIMVTSERVLDFTEVSFLNHNMAEAPLEHIQDVRGTVKGIAGSIFHFGTVSIFTANHTIVLELEMVNNPIESSRKILDFVQKKQSDPDGILFTSENGEVHSINKALVHTQHNFASRIKNFFTRE